MGAVLLDCLGTLVELLPPAPRLRDELRRRAGIVVGERAAAAAFRAEIGYYLAHHLDAHDGPSLERLRDQCAGVLLESLALPPREHGAVRAAMLASIRFEPYPDAAPGLADLRRRGIRLVAASNWDCSLPEVLDRAGLLELLDGVVASATVGAAKPDARLFEAALACAGCDPEAALFVGDSLENDVAGASAVGVAAVLVRRDGTAPARGGLPVISSLDELGSLV